MFTGFWVYSGQVCQGSGFSGVSIFRGQVFSGVTFFMGKSSQVFRSRVLRSQVLRSQVYMGSGMIYHLSHLVLQDLNDASMYNPRTCF